MFANSYVGIVEPEVTRLIVRHARRLRIHGDEIDDLQQQIVPQLAGFHFDVARSNGASLTTALTSVIDRQVKAYLRAKHRYRKRLYRLHAMCTAGLRCDDFVEQPEPTDLRMDLRAAMEPLSQRDRAICQFLSEGLSIKAIAKQLRCGRDTIGRAILRIRDQFIAAGLKAWVDPNDAGIAETNPTSTERQR